MEAEQRIGRNDNRNVALRIWVSWSEVVCVSWLSYVLISCRRTLLGVRREEMLMTFARNKDNCT